MSRHPMRLALARVCKRAFLRTGAFRLADELGVTPLQLEDRTGAGEEAGHRLSVLSHVLTRSMLVGTFRTPTHKRFEEEHSRLVRATWSASRFTGVLVYAWSNSAEARRISRKLEGETLPPLWQRRKGGAWVAGTPLGEVRYECLVERHNPHAHVVLFVENGPTAAIDPGQLLSIWTVDYLCFEDVAVFTEHYRCFLLVLNAFITELREEIAASSEPPEEA